MSFSLLAAEGTENPLKLGNQLKAYFLRNTNETIFIDHVIKGFAYDKHEAIFSKALIHFYRFRN